MSTLALAADYYLRHRPGPVVVNLSTTCAMDDVCRRHGVLLYRTPVGEANVVEQMRRVGACIGGDGNGGVILPALHAGRDAMVGMALLLQAVATTGRSLAELHAALPHYHMIKRSVELVRPVDDAEIVALARREFDGTLDTSDGVKVMLPEGWLHLRRSNTEPIVRAITESQPALRERPRGGGDHPRRGWKPDRYGAWPAGCRLRSYPHRGLLGRLVWFAHGFRPRLQPQVFHHRPHRLRRAVRHLARPG